MKNFFKKSIISSIVGFGLITSVSAETITVSNTNTSGVGSLHQAIVDANANPSPTTIKFNLSGNKTIPVSSLGLPVITAPLEIDAEAKGNVTLLGGSIGQGGANPALSFDNAAGGSTVKFLIFDHFLFAIQTQVRGLTIANNQFKNNQGGIDVRVYANQQTISGNEFLTPNVLGVQINSTSGHSIVKNTFNGASLVATSSNGNVIGGSEENKNTFLNTGNDGVFVTGNGNNISYNTISGTNGDGVFAAGNGNNISNNTISGASQEGIEVVGIDNDVKNNTLSNITSWDIKVQDGYVTEITENKITGFGSISRGIYAEGGQGYKIVGNTVDQAQIYVKSVTSNFYYGSFDIKDNEVKNDPFGFSGHGSIEIHNSNNVQVTNNHVHNGASQGIYIVDGQDHQLVSNSIHDNARSAIRIISNESVQLSKNTTYHNHSDSYNGQTGISGLTKAVPVITSAQVVGTKLILSGTVTGNANTIEVFLSDKESVNFTQNAYSFLGSASTLNSSWSVTIAGYTGDDMSFLVTGTEGNQTSSYSAVYNMSSMFTQYRTYSGVNNNLGHINYGKAGNQFVRAVPSEYGSTDPFNSLAGQNRKSAREISNIVANQPIRKNSTQDLSSLVYAWGQFIDHDVDLTAEGTTEAAPIFLPANEPLMTAPIGFSRSAAHEGTGINTPREHTNEISSWIDASMVYGSDVHRAKWLRKFQDGKLKTSAGDLLPYNTITGEYSSSIDVNAPKMAGDGEKTVKLFVAGDVRANEQAGLTSLHTLFVREHNALCDEYKAMGYSSDEEIYQMARKKVGAMIQKITFNDWLPALGINLPSYTGYNSNIEADITNEFATAAFRIGHTMLQDELLLLNDDLSDYGTGSLALKDAFFRPDRVSSIGIEPILKGLAYETQQEVDEQLVDAVRNFLFAVPGATVGIDLAALNIQRGRDHGLADYNDIRNTYVGNKVSSFAQINSNSAVSQKLATAYPSVNDIDPWMGMLAEAHVENGTFGPTIQAILTDQFGKLRDGDAFYYKNDPFMFPHEKTAVDNTTLASVLERNTGNSYRTNVFFNTNSARIASEENTSNQDAVVVYPNPSNGQFTIDVVLGQASTVEVQVYNLVGEQVFTTTEADVTNLTTDVSLENQVSGVYLVKVITANGTHTEKVLVK